jgi:hypothetical protein
MTGVIALGILAAFFLAIIAAIVHALKRPASEHPLPGLVVLGYITAVFLPVVGFILGIVAATRPDARTAKHGVWVIAVSILVFVAAVGAITLNTRQQASTAQRQLVEQARSRQSNEAIESNAAAAKAVEAEKLAREEARIAQRQGQEETAALRAKLAAEQRALKAQERQLSEQPSG